MQAQLQFVLAAYKKIMPSGLLSSESGKPSRRAVDLPMVHNLLHLLFPSQLYTTIPQFYRSKEILCFSPSGCGGGPVPVEVHIKHRRKGRWILGMFLIDQNLGILQEISAFRGDN